MTPLDILIKYQHALSEGLIITFRLALIIWTVGIVCGSLVGALSSRWPLSVGFPVRTVSFILSGVPVLVFLFWLHYPLQGMLGVVIDPFFTAAATLSIINVFAVSDIIRTVLNEFPQQYLVAAKVCGIEPLQALLYIQLPIILRQAIPSLLTLQVNMLQMTLFASLISVGEVFRVAQQINSQIYRPVEIYTALGLLFLCICLPMNGIALWLKSRYTRDFSER